MVRIKSNCSFCFAIVFIFLAGLLSSARIASAGTPSYIGPYNYYSDSNGFTSLQFTDESSLMQWVLQTYQTQANYCNYALVPPTAAWLSGINETSPVEGMETMARRGFSVTWNLGSAASCRTDLPPNGVGITSIRKRLVCASNQLYVQNGNKCVTLTPVVLNDTKGANGGKAYPSVGDPINPGKGNMWDEQTDIVPPDGSARLALRRTYNSDRYLVGQTTARAFGARWTNAYDANLVQTLAATSYSTTQCWRRSDNNELLCPPSSSPTFSSIPDAVNVFTGDGKSYLFNRNGIVWTGDADTNDRIYPVFNSDSTAVLAWTYVSASDDSKRYFDAHGLLLSITARNGTAESLTYSTGTSNDTAGSRYPATAPVCAQVQDDPVVFAGLLLCVTDHWGRQLHDSAGRIIAAIAPTNQSYFYEYDGPSGGCPIPDSANRACTANNLTKVTYPDGRSRTYFYNEASLINNGALCNISTPPVGNGFGQLLNVMTGKVDENGSRFATWTYECEGKATSSQLAGGVQKAAMSYLVYSTGDTDTTVTRSFGDPAAPQTRVQHYLGSQVRAVIKNTSISQPCAECGPIKTRKYDANGNVANEWDFNGAESTGVSTGYTFDLTRNLVLTRNEAVGSSMTRKTTYSWHPSFRLPMQIAQAKRITSFTYDGTGNLLTRIEQATSDSAGAAGFSAAVVGAPRVWTYTYNSDGQVLTVTGPRTDIADLTTYAYDAVGNLSTITNALGQITSLSDYDGNGNVGRIVVPNGAVTTMLYTARGWLASRTVSTLSATETTAYEYDGVGQLKKVTLPDFSTISYNYDDAHRLTGFIDSLGNSVSYTLDLTGNRVAEQIKDPGGNAHEQHHTRIQFARTPAAANWRCAMNRLNTHRTTISALIVALSYTPMLGTITSTAAFAQAAQNTTSNYLYDAVGNLTRITAPLGRVTDMGYDTLNRLSVVTQPTPASGVSRPVINYSYDGLDQVATVKDPRSLTTTYTVDGVGNRTVLSSPDTGNAGMTYDPAGNVLTATDARGKVTTFTYDALNRVTSVSYTTGTASVFEYDGGAGGTATDIGHLTKMSDESGQTRFSYDGMGRLLSKVQASNSASGATATLSTSYTYGTEGSATGKLTSVTYPSGNRINYAYDAAGRVSGLTLNPSDLAGVTNTATTKVLLSNIGYSPFGRAQSWTWGNSGPAQANIYARTFDLDGRTTSYPLGNSASGGLVRTVVYDAANRIISLTHTGAGTPASFDQSLGYDGLDRLTSFTSSTESLGYSYDASGNRIQFRINATAYNNTIASASNRLSSIAGPAPGKSDSFDAAGNTTSDGTVTYIYSDRGRLKRSTKAAVPTDYLYNAIGQRLSKTGVATATGVNFYAYDVQGHVAGEYTAGGAALEETVYLDDTPVAVLNSGGVYYVYADHINTPRVITNSTDNTIVWRWDQADPFGRGAPNENPSGLPTFSYNLRFPGHVFDVESGLHYNYYRDYDPQTGRYIQSDPIGLAGGINTYGYVGGNPLSRFDPTGLETVIIVSGSIPSNPFGHVAVATTGNGVQSYGTIYGYGSSTTDYVADQLRDRNVTTVTMNTTPAQEKIIVDAMNKFRKSPYSVTSNNCADAVLDAMGKAGIGEGTVRGPILPKIPAGVAQGQPGSKTQTIFTGGSLPPWLSDFNPK